MRWLFVILAVLIGVPSWTGSERLPLLPPGVSVQARRYLPDGGWPARIGALEPVGGVRLSAGAATFGGFSALAIRGGVATLLSDGGNVARIAIRGGLLTTVATGALPGGPGRGWSKESRDSESLTLDPRTGRAWIGFERANAIWRYSPDLTRAEAQRALPAMRRWPVNGGAESLVRLRDGRFVVLAEEGVAGEPREGLIVAGDPTVGRPRVGRFRYRQPAGYRPSDAVQLPDGDLLVLNRRFRLPLRFSAKLVRVPLAALRAGALVSGREVATLAPPLLRENAEGLAITHERGATMLWIVTDNDESWWRPTLLLKFRLRQTRERPAARSGRQAAIGSPTRGG